MLIQLERTADWVDSHSLVRLQARDGWLAEQVRGLSEQVLALTPRAGEDAPPRDAVLDRVSDAAVAAQLRVVVGDLRRLGPVESAADSDATGLAERCRNLRRHFDGL